MNNTTLFYAAGILCVFGIGCDDQPGPQVGPVPSTEMTTTPATPGTSTDQPAPSVTSPYPDHDAPSNAAPAVSIGTAPQIVAWGRFRPNGGAGDFAVSYRLVDASIQFDGTELRFTFEEALPDTNYIVQTTTANDFAHSAYVPQYTVSKQTGDGFTIMVQNIKGEPVSWKQDTPVGLGVTVVR